MFHTDIWISRNNNKERHIHAHYNYTAETIAAVRNVVTRVGNDEKTRGPYNVKIHTEDDHGDYTSDATFLMELTDDFKNSYILGN